MKKHLLTLVTTMLSIMAIALVQDHSELLSLAEHIEPSSLT